MVQAINISGAAARKFEGQVAATATSLVRSGTGPRIDRGELSAPPGAMPEAVEAVTGMVQAQQGFGLNLTAVRTANEMMGTLLDVIA